MITIGTRRTSWTLALILALLCISLFVSGCKKDEGTSNTNVPVVKERTVQGYRWPLTGLPAKDEAETTLRPLSVKIENSPQAQPQRGLNSADVIYESMIEGAESRFNCLFQSTIPKSVGPVRSARHTDLWIVPQYQGMLFFSGANREVRGKLNTEKLTLVSEDTVSGLFERITERRSPHNLYLNAKKAYAALDKKGVDTHSDHIQPLYFDKEDATPSAEGALAGGIVGESAKSVDIQYYQHAVWTWDPEKKVYLRTTGGKPHMDAATNEQVWIDNVVVMYADYSTANAKDPAGSQTYDTNMGGEGRALLFRDGYLYRCTWKADRSAPPKLFDETGKEVPLKPGRTCFEVPPKTMLKVVIDGKQKADNQ